jgi:hypothetical protein
MLNIRTIFCQIQRAALFAAAGIRTVVYIKNGTAIPVINYYQ